MGRKRISLGYGEFWNWRQDVVGRKITGVSYDGEKLFMKMGPDFTLVIHGTKLTATFLVQGKIAQEDVEFTRFSGN